MLILYPNVDSATVRQTLTSLVQTTALSVVLAFIYKEDKRLMGIFYHIK